MFEPCRKGPCPIPSCTLEWHVAIMLFVIALVLLFVPDSAMVARGVTLARFSDSPICWALVIGLPGLFQIAVLFTHNRVLHRWAAAFSAAGAFLITQALWASGTLSIPAVVLLVETVSEVYVFLMLRGARWSFSKNSSIGFPGNGSSAQRS